MVIICIGLFFLLAYILLSCYRGKDILEPLVTASSELADAVAKELENADPYAIQSQNSSRSAVTLSLEKR